MAVKLCCGGENMSVNKKSIFGLRNQIFALLLVASFLVGVSGLDTDVSCANVKKAFEAKGMLSAVDIQEQPNSDAGGLCLNRGCCGGGARPRLTQHARTHLEAALRTELIKLSEMLSTRAKKFDEFFRKLLQQSREDFHAMFKRTYGMIYEQHSYVFEQLFEQLERYYSRGDTDLDTMMEKFFGILYQKMFTVLNSQYSFDDKYLQCVNAHMRDTQPFDDVPRKLSVQLRRALVATRTFHKALRAGGDVARAMLQVGVTQECVAAWARLRHCGACAGAAPPCGRYCHNVLRGCLPAHADLGPHWDSYIDAIEKVAERLIGPFNVVMVVEPIDIKISEAIMNFQEHNADISQKIFAGCGKPVLGAGAAAGPFFAPDRSRRAADRDDDFELEASYESLVKDARLRRDTDELSRAAASLARAARGRERVLRYVRGRRAAGSAGGEGGDGAVAAGEGEGTDYDAEEYDYSSRGRKRKPAREGAREGGNQWDGSALSRLVRETRARARAARRLWAGLPYALCAETSTRPVCFNGTASALYSLPAAAEGAAALASNPEVRGAAAGGAAALAQQERLRLLTGRLKDAYNGAEVLWPEDDEREQPDLEAAATRDLAGSGSGSGDRADDDDDRADDYPASGEAPPDDDDAEDYAPSPTAPPAPPAAPPAPPAATAPPAPEVVPGGRGANVRLPTGDTEPRTGGDQDAAADQHTPAAAPGAAARPSLPRALLAYTLPVVCAWLGNVVTDLL